MDLIPDKKILKIGKKEIDYSWICVERTLRAQRLNNEIFKTQRDNYEAVHMIIDAVVILIRVDFSFTLNWLKRRFITKKYILNHLNYTELSDFVEIALDPIMGDKKKELKAEQAIDEILEKLREKMTIAQLTELLQKQLVSTDGQKTTSLENSA